MRTRLIVTGMKSLSPYLVLLAIFASSSINSAYGQHEHNPPAERANIDDYYTLETIPYPAGVAMEGTGMVTLPDSRIAVGTRRGDIWILQNPYMYDGENPRFTRFAEGLHEPIGLEYKDGAFYIAQRGELTRIKDRSGDGIADSYETVYSWDMSGNHHAYSYGPKKLPDGRMWVMLGLDSPWGSQDHTASHALWRGWAGIVSDDGTFEPIATGVKQGIGFGLNAENDMFFTDHDGPFVGSGYLTHVEKGNFFGHPAGLKWQHHPDSPVNLGIEYDEIPSTTRPMYEIANKYEGWKLPAVWLPHGSEIGQAAQSDMLVDQTGGKFGPYKDQLFISDYTSRSMARVFLEKVDGTYQGAAFPFMGDFLSGPVAQTWGNDGSMFMGMTDRGFAASGEEPHGMQRISWTGEVPFEVKAIRAMPDGFELEFTKPADPDVLNDPSQYTIQSFTYMYRVEYASPIIDDEPNPILGVKASEDGMRVRLVVDNLRKYHIHEIKLGSLADKEGIPLLHDIAYYTLNNIPEGDHLDLAETVRPEPPKVEEEVKVEVKEAAAPPVAETNNERITGRVTEMPASWTEGPDVSISMAMIPGLKFDLESFEVPASGRIRLTLSNEDDMVHNAVITEPGAADEVGIAAINIGPAGMQQGYIPDNDKVLFYTRLLGEGESESIYFTAPQEPGSYQYVCTIPGHHVMMRGIMYVR